MKFLLTILTLVLLTTSTFAQDEFLSEDYQIFGRKEPISLGSLFSTLAAGNIFVNPANIAFVTDNRINFGRGVSGVGNGMFISWSAPNLSISSSTQKVRQFAGLDGNHEKQLLHFNFGISTQDLGYEGKNGSLGIGVAVKRQADRLFNLNNQKIAGGNSVSVDLGLLLKWKRLALEAVMLDVNTPKLSDSDVSYGRGFIVGGRFTTRTGLTIALQGIGGNAYAGSDFGMSFGAQQTFMENRLISRLQLTSFFTGLEATMQNISASIGYRLNPKKGTRTFLKDVELSYALSFLALPQNVGTHLVVLTKYF